MRVLRRIVVGVVTAGVLVLTSGLVGAATAAADGGGGPGACHTNGKGQSVHHDQMFGPLDICPGGTN